MPKFVTSGSIIAGIPANFVSFSLITLWTIFVLFPYLMPGVPDKLIWGATSNGKFSVKSAYLLIHSEPIPNIYVWTRNWKMPIPPKMKIFLWTLVAKKLMTNQQRMHRNFTTDPSCFHCPSELETMLHLFRDCPKAMLVWNSFHIPPSMAATFHLDWDAWLYANMLQVRCFHINIPWNVFFTFTCWHIWKWRCKCTFDSRFNLPFDMKNIIFSYINEWKAAAKKISIAHPKHSVMLSWQKPPNGTMKVNVDGSLNSGGFIGAGGILRDCSGGWHGGFMINLGTGDILQAEAWGMFYGIQLALRFGHQNVIFESDSASLINLLSNNEDSMHPLATVISNCQMLAGSFSSCSFCHIHRERNHAPIAMIEIITDDIAGIGKSRCIPIQVPLCPSSLCPEGDNSEDNFHVRSNNTDANVRDGHAVTSNAYNTAQVVPPATGTVAACLTQPNTNMATEPHCHPVDQLRRRSPPYAHDALPSSEDDDLTDCTGAVATSLPLHFPSNALV